MPQYTTNIYMHNYINQKQIYRCVDVKRSYTRGQQENGEHVSKINKDYVY